MIKQGIDAGRCPAFLPNYNHEAMKKQKTTKNR